MVKTSTKILIAISGGLGTVLGIPAIQQLLAGWFSGLVANHPNLLAIVGSLAVILSLIHQPQVDSTQGTGSSAVKNSLGLFVIVAVGLSMSGCDGYKVSQTVHTAVANAVVLAQDELPSLEALNVVSAQEGTLVSGFLNGVTNLNAQFDSCSTNAQQTTLKNSGKFVA